MGNPLTFSALATGSNGTFDGVGDLDSSGSGFIVEFTAATNQAPTADAGENQSIRAGDTVTLNGIASFDDNTASASLVYDWNFVSTPVGSTATLDDANSVTPSFVADVAGTYVVELIVTDEELLESVADYVEISSENMAPTAVATASESLAIVNSEVVLDGSTSSDPEGDAITYSWTITSAPLGSAAQLVDANTAMPTLTPDLEGLYEISLEVSDFLGPGVPATVEFTATTVAGYAEFMILCASDIVAELDPGQVTTKGNQNAFQKHLAKAIRDLQNGDTADAIKKLNQVITRTDGCPLRGSPDGNGSGRDWITDCDAQEAIFACLSEAIAALE